MDVNVAAKLSAVLGLILFCNSLNLQFCLDDAAAIVSNPDLLGNVSWLNLFKNDFWGKSISDGESHKSYRPLTVATFRLNYMLHELQPLGYHLVNVLLHSAVCYLYVLLCGAVFSEVWPALIAGLLFAVHPIHTEAVSGVVGRADILCALFTLAALYCYQKSLRVTQNIHSLVWFLTSLLCILCGALCKEIGITATVLCLAYEIVLHGKDSKRHAKGLRARDVSMWTFIVRALVLGIFSVSFYWMRITLNQGPPPFHMDNNPAIAFPTPLRQLHWSYLCVLNVWLLLSPSQLCAEYAMGTIPPIASLTDPRNLLTLATFASLLSVGCYAMSTRDAHHRKLLFGLCLMIVPFIPASNLFFPVGFVIAERVLYIPSMGFSMIVAYGAWLLISNQHNTSLSRLLISNRQHISLNKLTKSIIMFLLLTHSIKTYTRNWDWKDNTTLFSSGLKVSKTSAKMWHFLGNTYYKNGNRTLAGPFFRKAIEVEPLFTSGYVGMVRVLKREEKYMEAIEQAEQAAELIMKGVNGENLHYYLSDRKVLLELARLLLTFTDRYEEAFKWSKKTAELLPDWEAPYHIMGKVLIKLGKHSKAKIALKKSLELKEDFSEAHTSLADALSELEEFDESETHYRRALALGSEDISNKFGLVKVILNHKTAHTTDRLMEALTIASDLLLVEPDNGNLTFSVAILHSVLGDVSLALEYIDRTIEITPNDSSIYWIKAEYLYKKRRFAEAEEWFSKAERHTSVMTHEKLFLRGTNLLSMLDYKKALSYLTAALEINPDDEATQVNYGITLVHIKEYDKALEIFQKLTRQYPDNAGYSRQVLTIQQRLTAGSDNSAI